MEANQTQSGVTQQIPIKDGIGVNQSNLQTRTRTIKFPHKMIKVRSLPKPTLQLVQMELTKLRMLKFAQVSNVMAIEENKI